MRRIKSLCTHCSLNCGFYLMRDGEVKGIDYWEDHPFNRGALCEKGNLAHKVIYSNRRLLHPLIKVRGKLRKAKWGRALNFTADKLGKIKKKYGAGSIFILPSGTCTNEEMRLIKDFANTIGTKNVYTPFVQISSELEGAVGHGASKLSEVVDGDQIFILGNPVEQNPVSARYILKAKYENNARITLADTRYTPTAWFSNLTLQHAPGTEAAMLCGMAKVIIERGLFDKRSVERISNFKEFRKSLKAMNLNEICRSAGLDLRFLTQAASGLTDAERPFIVYTTSITQYPNFSEIVKSIANLALITNAGVCPLHGPANAQGAIELGIGGMKNDKEMRVALLFGDSHEVHADFVVVSQTFLSRAAHLADVVLPSACFAEKRGTFTNVEGTRQVMENAVVPLGNAKPNSWIVTELAKKMGLKLAQAKSNESRREGKSERNFQLVDTRLKVPKRDKRYPFMIITEQRIFNAEHELISDAIDAIKGRPSSYIEINTADARDLKIKHGELVKISTAEGKMERTAILSEFVPRRVTFIPDYKICAASIRRS